MLATPDVVQLWVHLQKIANEIDYQPYIEIGMVIDLNVPTAYQPSSKASQPSFSNASYRDDETRLHLVAALDRFVARSE